MRPAPAPSAFRRHDGRLAAARARFPEAPEPWLDLSTGINPRPYPAPRFVVADEAVAPRLRGLLGDWFRLAAALSGDRS
jgi:cobalamin biosynthetic protein CobC